MTFEEYDDYVVETAILNRKMIEMNIENQSKMAGVFEKLDRWLDLEIKAREKDGVDALEYTPKSRWQPIETAPRDGTFFIAFEPVSGMGVVYYAEDGKFYSGSEISEWEEWHPTHWMPLPDPPKDDE